MINGLQVLKSEKLVTSDCMIDKMLFFSVDDKNVSGPSVEGQNLLKSLVAKDTDTQFFEYTFNILTTSTVDIAC